MDSRNAHRSPPSSSMLAVAMSLLALATANCAGSGGGNPSAPTVVPTQAESPQAPAPAPSQPANEWDVAAKGLPTFVTRQYLDLAAIGRISRFRSGLGHSYADAFESCRSMKHYFEPRHGTNWGAIPIYAPVDGTLARSFDEWAGVQLQIEPSGYPAFRVILFHVKPTIELAAGTSVRAGDLIGTHIGTQTMSDVAVSVNTPQGFQLVSWFDVMDDGTFGEYVARGLRSRREAVITRTERDSSPLNCEGERFTSPGTLENWVTLAP